MSLLRLYTDLSVCSAIVGASYAGAPCPGALVANLSKSHLSQVDFMKNLSNSIIIKKSNLNSRFEVKKGKKWIKWIRNPLIESGL